MRVGGQPPRPLYPLELAGTPSTGDWVVPRACLDGGGKPHLRRNSIPGRPVRGQLLYFSKSNTQ